MEKYFWHLSQFFSTSDKVSIGASLYVITNVLDKQGCHKNNVKGAIFY